MFSLVINQQMPRVRLEVSVRSVPAKEQADLRRVFSSVYRRKRWGFELAKWLKSRHVMFLRNEPMLQKYWKNEPFSSCFLTFIVHINHHMFHLWRWIKSHSQYDMRLSVICSTHRNSAAISMSTYLQTSYRYNIYIYIMYPYLHIIIYNDKLYIYIHIIVHIYI